MKHLISLSILSTVTASFLLSACGKSSSPSTPSTTVNNDEASFEKRVTTTDQNIEVVPTETSAQLTSASLSNVLTLAAEILPPTINGVLGQANAIAINNQGVAIAYNVAGDVQSGAIDIVNIEGKNAKIKSELQFATRDINGIFWGKSAIYAAGADSATGHGFLSRIRVDGVNLTNTVTDSVLVGHAGTGVYSSGSLIYTTSGDDGEFATYDFTTLAKKSSVSAFDARALGYSSTSGQMFAFSGQPGTLRTFTKDGALVSTAKVGGATIAQSKSTIQVGDAMSLVSLGAEGFSIVCNADGSSLGSMKVPVAVAGAKVVTNGASIYKNLIFAANGEAGVYVYTATPANPLLPTTKCQPITIVEVGYLNFGAKVSANAVEFKNDSLIVATGTGGLKVVNVDGLSLLPSVIGGESNGNEGGSK